MNCETGEIFNSMGDGIKEAMSRGLSEIEASAQLMPLELDEYDHLKGMNRAQRRQWARENKKKKPKPSQPEN